MTIILTTFELINGFPVTASQFLVRGPKKHPQFEQEVYTCQALDWFENAIYTHFCNHGICQQKQEFIHSLWETIQISLIIMSSQQNMSYQAGQATGQAQVGPSANYTLSLQYTPNSIHLSIDREEKILLSFFVIYSIEKMVFFF